MNNLIVAIYLNPQNNVTTRGFEVKVELFRLGLYKAIGLDFLTVF